MTLGKRIYWVAALVAVLALAGAAITVTSRLTSAGGPTPTAGTQTCAAQDGADDAAESTLKAADTDTVEAQGGPDDAAESGVKEADTDTVDLQCGDQDTADD